MKAQGQSAAIPAPSKARKWRIGVLVVVVLVLGGWFVIARMEARKAAARTRAKTAQSVASPVAESDAKVFAAYGGSRSCRDCHQQAFERWQNSHHARAERPFNLTLDLPVFYPPRAFKHGTQTSQARYLRQRFELITLGVESKPQTFQLERVLGETPLRQYLVAHQGGRLQVTELASDPIRRDWFDIFGDEDRQPGEWGHWSGRGMTWNSMCAACHNTRVRKNFLPATDAYATRMAEMGVGCEACHGPMAEHVAWQRRQKQPVPSGKDPTIRRLTKDQMLDVCGSCHARRTEFTGDFAPGARFLDHHGLIIPDETDIYYPDGQVREEDYEYTSFLSSRMYGGGVRCEDCHEPHTSKPPTLENVLCLRCHTPPLAPAPKIEAAKHSFHRPGEAGDRCIDCHMPQTPYMQRHWRHDHGFTIPDPLLTKQHNIPNACNRCHKDKTADWALEAVEKWYGPRMERPTRARAQWIAKARAGQSEAFEPLVRLLGGETNALWRAVVAGLLKGWPHHAPGTTALLKAIGDRDPLVRTMAARSLEPLAATDNRAVSEALERLLRDPVRSVRVEAAWGLRATLDTNCPAAADLFTYLAQNVDQPSGLLQVGVFHLDRGEVQTALPFLEKAVQWDKASAPLRHALAVALSLQGRRREAVRELETACKLAPREAEYRFKLGLALNETGRLDDALSALAEAVKLEPRFAQAWYNLGLAYSAAGQTDSALDALIRAESLDPSSAQAPYARATILARLRRLEEARAAVRRALELQPNHPEARTLMQLLTPR